VSYLSEVLAEPSLVALYRSQEASGVAQDSSGNARHGDGVNGAPTFAQAGAIPSDGTSKSWLMHSAGPDWFNIPYFAAFDIGDAFTVECWIKRADASTAEMDIVSRDQGFGLGLINNQLMLFRSGVASICKSTTTITDTTLYHHLAVTKNGATCATFIDAADVSGAVTNSTCTNGTTPTVKLGADAGGSPFNGNLSEIAIYSAALSSARIAAHFNAAPAGISAISPRLGGSGLRW
jgi:hypothetical protein